MRFRGSLASLASLAVLLWACSAAADAADAASEAASTTARKLRHTFDQLRTPNPAAASCVEDKVARAVTLANRIARRRVDLREASDDKSRALASAAIVALDGERRELEEQAEVCVHGKPGAFPGSGGTKVTVYVPSLPESSERELVMLVLGLPTLGR